MQENYVAILLEDIQSTVKVIAEGHGSLVDNYQRLAEAQTETNQRLGRLEVGFDVLSADLRRIDGRMERVEHHLGLNGSGKKKKVQRQTPRR